MNDEPRRTKEELMAIAKEQGRKVAIIRAAIIERHGIFQRRGAHDVNGVIQPCPVCGEGTLHYRRAAYNGHIAAQCTTAGCTSFME